MAESIFTEISAITANHWSKPPIWRPFIQNTFGGLLSKTQLKQYDKAWIGRLAVEGRRLTRLEAAGRGAVILVVLLGLSVISVAQLFPRHVTPADPSPEQFSAERALAHQLRHRPPAEHDP